MRDFAISNFAYNYPGIKNHALSGFSRSSPDDRFCFFFSLLFEDGDHKQCIERHAEERYAHNDGQPVIVKKFFPAVVTTDIGEYGKHKACKDYDDNNRYGVAQRNFICSVFIREFFPEPDDAHARDNIDKTLKRRRHQNDEKIIARDENGDTY